MSLHVDTYLNAIPFTITHELEDHLDPHDRWKRLFMAVENSSEDGPRLDQDFMVQLELCHLRGESPTRKLLIDLGHKGYQVRHLRVWLRAQRLMRAAELLEDAMPRVSGFTEGDCLDLYRKAITDNPTINLHIGKAMTIGPPRVGKTYLRYLLLGLPPPKKCFSTPVMKTAETVHIPHSTGHPSEAAVDLDSSDEEDLAQRCGDRGRIKTELFVVTSESDKWVIVSEASGIQSLLSSLAAKQAPFGLNQEGPNTQQGTRVILGPQLSTTHAETPKELLRLLQSHDSCDVTFSDAKILQFLDCGGQLAYHDILPVFTTFPSIYLHVFDLTKDLMECPMDQICIEGEEQESYSEAFSPVPTAQMITRSVIAISSLKNKKGKLPDEVLLSKPSKPSVMLVGTHLDELEEGYGADAEQKTKEVDSMLQEALKSEYLEEMVVKNRHHSLPGMFFPVNNRLFAEDYGGQGSKLSRRSIKHLKREISRQTYVQVKVPVKWYLYQLLEMSKSEKERKPVHRYKELYQSCQRELVVADVGEFHTMVTYFNALGLLVHLCGEDVAHTEESACFIFTNPSYLFENISKLYQVQFLDEQRCHGGLLSLKRRGILTEDSLQDLRVDDVHLKHRDFMDVLVQLFIGAEIREGNKDKSKELFLPSVLMLPAGDHPNSLQLKPQNTLPQFFITFEQASFVPCGVFTGAIARLLSIKKWKILQKSISRVHIPFAVGACDIVHLFDCATHIGVELAVGDKQNTQKYRDTILDTVAESYCFLFHQRTVRDRESSSCKECRSNPFLVLGLMCPTCKPDANHIAVLHVEDGHPQTVRCQESHDYLSDEQKLLFQNMEHYAVALKQHTPSVAGGVMTLPHCVEEVTSVTSSAPHTEYNTGSTALPQQDVATTASAVHVPPPGGAAGGQVTSTQDVTHASDVLEALEQKVDSKWRHFGTFLRFEPSLMNTIQSDNSKSVTDCMLDLITKWVCRYEGSGDLPRTWQTVVEAVWNLGERKIAEELAKKYGVSTVPPPPPPTGSTTGSAGQPLLDTVLSTSETAESLVSSLKRPPAYEVIPPMKRRDIEEGTTPKATPNPSPSVDPLRDELLSSKPTSVPLLKKVIPSVAHKWHQLGVHLGIQAAILKTFTATGSHSLELCCLEMFERWLEGSGGTGESPRTWSTVLSAVGDCLGRDVADNIERALLEERRQRK